MHVMVSGLLPKATQTNKIGVSDGILELIILRLIKNQNTYVVLNTLNSYSY